MKREYHYSVRPEHMDLSRRTTIKALYDMLLDAACKDADNNGFGTYELSTKYNLTWVLIRVALSIEKLPVEDEQLTIKTWVNEVSKLSTTREFQVCGADGSVYATATTLWTLIGMDSRKLCTIDSIPVYSQIAQPEYGAATTAPVRLKSPEADYESVHRVSYSDVDINRHAHASNYMLWAIDTLPVEELLTDRHVKVELNYLHETFLGEEVTIRRNSSNPYLFELSTSETQSCRIQIEWTD